MTKPRKLDINYRVYTMLVIRQRLPYLLFGLLVFVISAYFIFSNFIIRKYSSKKSTTQKHVVTTRIKYTVREGEDLWQIAEKHYGSGYNAYDIARANNLVEPYILNEGQVLVIPSVAKRSPTKGDLTPAAASTSEPTIQESEYIVQPGDYLFLIAQKSYGDGNLMWKIIEANNIPSPYNIEAGQKLLIPR
ncbi:MAG: LysM peptidoglycan-binding domain-containing protein [Patescibacteria group bacterium]